ncbi:Cilia- and flagella-associated protein 91 [Acropora cervicornis]|uniref:Cilia- and flagella-associated protein 91 n=1 Tax=Acropora cervicornis TaxID=6130 RepID=A0AAD9V1C7_ACRCE|nr:Cilia- and flagella-associated protein 91 [Acropora cervicornis]
MTFSRYGNHVNQLYDGHIVLAESSSNYPYSFSNLFGEITMSSTQTVTQGKIQPSRTHDYLYDPLYSLSSDRDHARSTFKAHTGTDRIKRVPHFKTMFSDLRHHPRYSIHLELTDPNNNYARLSRLLVDVGCTVLRDIFDSKHPPANLHTVLSNPSVLSTLLNLRKENILKPVQWERLFPPVTSNVSSANFDITLLMILLRNICGLSPPVTTGSWHKLPPDSDSSTEANITIETIQALRLKGALVTAAVISAIAKGIVMANDRTILVEHGRYLSLTYDWGRNVLYCMDRKGKEMTMRMATTEKISAALGLLKEAKLLFQRKIKTYKPYTVCQKI